MILKYDSNENITEITKEQWIKERLAYIIGKGKNGKNYVVLSSVVDYILHISEGNSKTGEHCINFNLSIEYTCDHNAPCYKEGICYAEGGCYTFGENQCGYSENVKFYNNVPDSVFIQALQMAIDITGYKLFRYFTCGDIPNERFIDCMVKLARNNADVAFWTYTKKYAMINKYIAEHGGTREKAFPENLVIIFSLWINDDGTSYPMENPYNLPVSVFVPLGKENIVKDVTYICPCSDPTVNATCETCKHPCHAMKCGETQALYEHSTKRTKERDKAIKSAKKALLKK